MSFRLLNLRFCRAGLAGALCLASGWAAFAGEMRARPIEVTRSRSSILSTNVNSSQSEESKNLDVLFPTAPKSLFPQQQPQVAAPPPRPSAPLSQREKELLDRRKNWVFLTPEEWAGGADSDKDVRGVKEYDVNGQEKQPMTVMQRYYQRLYEPEQRATTNQWNKPDADSWNKATNSIAGDQRDDHAKFSDSPFKAAPEVGIFQSIRAESSKDFFGGDSTLPSPETVRAQQAQEAHMESFKQLWNLDQPSAVDSGLSGGASISGANSISGSGIQPVLGTISPSVDGLSGPVNLAPVPPTVTPTRTAPPRPDFSVPQRRF